MFDEEDWASYGRVIHLTDGRQVDGLKWQREDSVGVYLSGVYYIDGQPFGKKGIVVCFPWGKIDSLVFQDYRSWEDPE